MTNAHGETLVGLLHHMGSDKVVVLCHGFRASKVLKEIYLLLLKIRLENINCVFLCMLFM